MAVLATDAFTRANDPSGLGANWTNSSASGNPLGILSNQATNEGSGAVLESYTNVAAPADQYAQCVLKALQATSDEGIGPAVRCSTTALTGYFAQCNTTEIKLYRVVAGSYVQLGTDAAAAAVNDVIYIEANGTAITVKKNGAIIIGPITNSAIASGNFGLWSGGGSAIHVLAVDDWEGGDLATAKRLLLTRS